MKIAWPALPVTVLTAGQRVKEACSLRATILSPTHQRPPPPSSTSSYCCLTGNQLVAGKQGTESGAEHTTDKAHRTNSTTPKVPDERERLRQRLDRWVLPQRRPQLRRGQTHSWEEVGKPGLCGGFSAIKLLSEMKSYAMGEAFLCQTLNPEAIKRKFDKFIYINM